MVKAATINTQPIQNGNNNIQKAFQNKLSELKFASRPNIHIKPQITTDTISFAGPLTSGGR